MSVSRRSSRSPARPRRNHRETNNQENVPLDEGLPDDTVIRNPCFWDRLSKVPLCSNALKEFRRRSRQCDYAHLSATAPVAVPRRSRRLQLRNISANNSIPSAEEILRHYSPGSLDELRRFAKHGGPDLSGVRGLQEPSSIGYEMLPSVLGRRKRGDTETRPRNTSTYDRAFQQHLIDHNILADTYQGDSGQNTPEPLNFQEIIAMLAKRRPSLSSSRWSKEDFKDFVRVQEAAKKERKIMSDVIPIIEGKGRLSRCMAANVGFLNLDHLTDGTICKVKPDLYHGACPEKLHRQVREDLKGQIISSTQLDLPIVPSFFLEVKGSDRTDAVLSRQATYCAAIGARGVQSLRRYRTLEPEYDNKAYVLAATYISGHLRIYACHPVATSASDGRSGYVMTQLNGWSLTGNVEDFCKAVAGYRNARDWAKEQRDHFIEQANEVARKEAAESSLLPPKKRRRRARGR